jgi:riboflavin biosynthesis pyrimidine reductase
MTEEQAIAAVRYLRALGYAVTLFNPEELNGVDSRTVEEVMVEAGANAIEYLE